MDVNEELKFLGKFKKKIGGGGAVRGGSGGQGGCERKKKNWLVSRVGLGGGGVRVDVNEELKFL